MIFSISSSTSEVKRMTSSRRLRNSGLNARFTSAITISSTFRGNRVGWCREAHALALLQVPCAKVRSHDHDRVLEVDCVAETVGQLAVFKHLQEDVVDIRMRLLDFVQQNDRIRLRASPAR